jgi:dTDP-4-amino-4,6-dideoxygalactose transaminase
MTVDQEILAAWARVLASGKYVLGPELEAFETELASYIGTDHAIGVSSGSDALRLILEAIGIEGREVIVPALTFIATAEAVIHAGGTPVFCDVDSETWCMTGKTVEPQISPKTAALLPVHLFGNPAPMDELSFEIPVIEDACQAIGSSYKDRRCGNLAYAAAFSFYPSKTLAACGDGGAITTNNASLAHRLRGLRSHGSHDNRTHWRAGHTARLDEIQAAALRVNLKYLPKRILAQRKRGMGDQVPTYRGISACHQTVFLSEGPGRHFYDPPLHLQPAMRQFYRGPLPNAERFARANHAKPPIEKASGPPKKQRGRTERGANYRVAGVSGGPEWQIGGAVGGILAL